VYVSWQWYLRTFFYKPCGLEHWAPSGGPDKMDYSGQCNDGFFRLAYEGKLTCVLDGIARMEAHEAVLTSGKRLPCDMLVVASGCKYNVDPPFLKDLGLGKHIILTFLFSFPLYDPVSVVDGVFRGCDLPVNRFHRESRNVMNYYTTTSNFTAGFKDLHNFAFLGRNPRIGCASDFVFAYVPFGPIKQLEMYFHAVDCCRKGLEEVRR